MRVKDVEPMIDMSLTSAIYQQPFGVKLTYSDGTSHRFTDFGLALCANLTKRQRVYVEDLQRQIHARHLREI